MMYNTAQKQHPLCTMHKTPELHPFIPPKRTQKDSPTTINSPIIIIIICISSSFKKWSEAWVSHHHRNHPYNVDYCHLHFPPGCATTSSNPYSNSTYATNASDDYPYCWSTCDSPSISDCDCYDDSPPTSDCECCYDSEWSRCSSDLHRNSYFLRGDVRNSNHCGCCDNFPGCGEIRPSGAVRSPVERRRAKNGNSGIDCCCFDRR
mmetsp:Transcript_12334/g.26244  ORF Transcript_12334/g.26244 Transcript_12334/m.26244 type:complete len:206 (-) Transcript_12334:342-959(-)